MLPIWWLGKSCTLGNNSSNLFWGLSGSLRVALHWIPRLLSEYRKVLDNPPRIPTLDNMAGYSMWKVYSKTSLGNARKTRSFGFKLDWIGLFGFPKVSHILPFFSVFSEGIKSITLENWWNKMYLWYCLSFSLISSIKRNFWHFRRKNCWNCFCYCWRVTLSTKKLVKSTLYKNWSEKVWKHRKNTEKGRDLILCELIFDIFLCFSNCSRIMTTSRLEVRPKK